MSAPLQNPALDDRPALVPGRVTTCNLRTLGP
jgi:hypothetical protein